MSFFFEVKIPANTSARIYLPCTDISKVRENGRFVKEINEMNDAGVEDDRLVLDVGSGQYLFQIAKN
ncbi:MAG: hypothetical protein AB2L24_02180 [Mangrovibacterium sp.]